MQTTVFIDGNVWDFLLERKIDLATELPADEFRIFITREAEFEIALMPSEKKSFAEATIASCDIKTDTFFGFNDDKIPSSEQRIAGFDQGRWASEKELAFMAELNSALKPTMRPTKLYKNEADISLAARSFHAVVLTLDDKKGPLSEAYRQGGSVVFLTDYGKSGLSLREFIRRAFKPMMEDDGGGPP